MNLRMKPLQKLLLMAVVVALSVTSALAAGVSFSAPVSYPVGIGPTSVAVGDFNGDGRLDMAVANGGSSNISILMGNGDGTFQAARNYALTQPPLFVAVGDFNGDHRLDLVAGTNQSVAILLGNGNGTLQPPTVFSVGTTAEFVVSADFNQDGKLDLLAASHSGDISILLGNGDGTFQPPTVTSTSGTTAFVAVADFNGDGLLDVATGNGGIAHEQGFGQLIILLGNGDGTFQLPTMMALPFWPLYFAASDLNGDGKIDLAAAAKENIFGGDIRVFFGNGDATFGVSSGIRGLFSSSVATADVNGDGKLDLIGLEHFDPQNLPIEIQFMLGNGNGGFQDVPNPCTQSTGCVQLSTVPAWLAVADLNADDSFDLIVTNPVANTISVLLNSIGAMPDFSLLASALTPSSVTAGQSATGTVTVTPSGGFNSTVSFSCSVLSFLTYAPTCAITPSGSGASITVMTTAASFAGSVSRSASWFYALWIPLIGLVATSVRIDRKGKNGLGLLLIVGILLDGITFQLACGGASGSQVKQISGGTPPGNYTITVSGTAGSLQHSISFVLAVK